MHPFHAPSPPPPPPTDDAIEAVIQHATAARGPADPRPLRDTRTQLFVGNLPYRVRWQDLKDLFRKAGTVLRADVSLGPDNRSRGHGTVLLATAEEAGRAVDMFNGYSWQTRILEVRLDRLPPEHDPAAPPPPLGPQGRSGLPDSEEEYMARYHAAADTTTSRNLFVGNLPFHCQWQDLKDLFRQAGTILRADVALGPDGRSRGFGTVVFATDYDAERAVGMFNGYEYNGRMLKVHFDRFTQALAGGIAGQVPALHPAGIGSFLTAPSSSTPALLAPPAASSSSTSSAISPTLTSLSAGPSSSSLLGAPQAGQGYGHHAALGGQQLQGFVYDFGSASGPSTPFELYSQLQSQIRAQQQQQQQASQQQQQTSQQLFERIQQQQRERAGQYQHLHTHQHHQPHAHHLLQQQHFPQPQQQHQHHQHQLQQHQQQQHLQSQTLHHPQAQHFHQRSLGARSSASGPPSTSASVAQRSIPPKPTASAADADSLAQGLAATNLSARSGPNALHALSSTASTSTTASTGSMSEWSTGSSATSLSQALSPGGEAGRERSASRSASAGASPALGKRVAEGTQEGQQAQTQRRPQGQGQQRGQSTAAQRALQLMAQSQQQQQQHQHRPGLISIPPPPQQPALAFQMQMRMSPHTPIAPGGGGGGGMWVGVLGGGSPLHHPASPYGTFPGGYGAFYQYPPPEQAAGQQQQHAEQQQQRAPQPGFGVPGLPPITPSMPPFVMARATHSQRQQHGAPRGQRRQRNTPSADASSSESSHSSGASRLSGRSSAAPSAPAAVAAQAPFAFPPPSPVTVVPAHHPFAPGHHPYAQVAGVHPMRLNLAGIPGPLSPGVVMSPGTFYGRPGEVVANPNPWINAAVGAPVHVGPVGGDGGTGAADAQAAAGGYQYATHGAYFYAMSSPKRTTATGTEPKGYFDPRYFPPGNALASEITDSSGSGSGGDVLSAQESSGTSVSADSDSSAAPRVRETRSHTVSDSALESADSDSDADVAAAGAPGARAEAVGHPRRLSAADTPVVMHRPQLKTKADSDPDQVHSGPWTPAESRGEVTLPAIVRDLKLPAQIPWRAAKAKGAVATPSSSEAPPPPQ